MSYAVIDKAFAHHHSLGGTKADVTLFASEADAIAFYIMRRKQYKAHLQCLVSIATLNYLTVPNLNDIVLTEA